VGAGALSLTHIHHFAALWPETEFLAERGLVGIACTAYMPTVAPAGSKEKFFGTNPISFAWRTLKIRWKDWPARSESSGAYKTSCMMSFRVVPELSSTWMATVPEPLMGTEIPEIVPPSQWLRDRKSEAMAEMCLLAPLSTIQALADR
jgi:hypothetical protein